MDQIEEVAADVPYKNESSIQIKLKDNIQRLILYNQVGSSKLLNFEFYGQFFKIINQNFNLF